MKPKSTESKQHRKERTGAWISAVVMMLWFLGSAGMAWLVLGVIPQDNAVVRFLQVFEGICLLCCIAVAVNLRTRLKEIKGGEMDAARQY